MSILEILEAHTYQARTTPHSMGYWARCACSWASEGQRSHDYDFTPEHCAHVAQVLEQHEREAKAEAWDRGAVTAWERSNPEVNGSNYHWRSSGEPRNPYRSGS